MYDAYSEHPSSLGYQVRIMVNTQLMDLPYELLHKVLYECEPADIKSLWETCRALNQLLKNNRQLYKEMYLKQLVRDPADGRTLFCIKSGSSTDRNKRIGLTKN